MCCVVRLNKNNKSYCAVVASGLTRREAEFVAMSRNFKGSKFFHFACTQNIRIINDTAKQYLSDF